MGVHQRDKDVSRADRKAKKRKAEDAVPDLPGDNDDLQPEQSEIEHSKKRKRYDKKTVGTGNAAQNSTPAEPRADESGGEQTSTKRSKKDKEKQATDVEADLEEAKEEPMQKKSKKERKAERKAAETAATSVSENAPTLKANKVQDGVAEASQKDETKPEAPKAKKNNRNREKKRLAASGATLDTTSDATVKAPARFIVFIGNLPFTATTESVKAHFAAVKPKSVRHLTQKDNPTKSKGCAFVEFEGYDHMKTCLKLYHHSTFDDGKSAPRKINVELTAGGGGKTKHRQAKIGEKNQKLNEQRTRRIHEEEKTKLVKKENAISNDGIHPSRRARVPDTQ